MNEAAQEQEASIDDLVSAAAVDSDFYGRTFFPRTMRMKAPHFHRELDDVIERQANRNIVIEAFRDSAKTSKLRMFTSKRIAYGTSRTILFISDTEPHAVKSVEWLARNIEFNKYWTQVYGLSQGKKWGAGEIEIIHRQLEVAIRIIALGIEGQLRGINVEDYRPDLIVVDDPLNEQNTNTSDQRLKIKGLFHGAIYRSLVPATENPDSKIVVLQTPMHRDDMVEELRMDPAWVSRRYLSFPCMPQTTQA